MSNLTTTSTGEMQTAEFSKQDLDLIKATVAKNATDQELKLFLYRSKSLGLNPLNPGEIYFVKFGSSPGAIVIGLDGFRKKASRTGKHTGTKRGVTLDDKGNCVGAWAEVSRADWAHPAREDVLLSEYNTGKAQWQKMPETMIKKVAEAAALRMAFPDELGGVYSQEEMDQQKVSHRSETQEKAREVQAQILEAVPVASPMEELLTSPFEMSPEEMASLETTAPSDIGSYVIPIGKDVKGLMLQDVDADKIQGLLTWCKKQKDPGRSMKEFMSNAEVYLNSL